MGNCGVDGGIGFCERKLHMGKRFLYREVRKSTEGEVFKHENGCKKSCVLEERRAQNGGFVGPPKNGRGHGALGKHERCEVRVHFAPQKTMHVAMCFLSSS